jgi:hypothetical protein
MLMRLCIRLGAALLLVFATVCIALAASGDAIDDQVRALLAPTGCPMPCWQGIRPQITTQYEALAILRAHPWINAESVVQSRARIEWSWNGAQPSFYTTRSSLQGRIIVEDGIVDTIMLRTLVRHGEARLLLGSPTAVQPYWADRRGMSFLEVYSDQALALWFDLPCPIRVYEYWGARVDVIIKQDPEYTPTKLSSSDTGRNVYYNAFCQAR